MSARTTVIAIGQLPPPITGFSYITACVLETASCDVSLKRYDLVGARGASGLRKHTSRLAATWRACSGLIKHARAPSRICYIACEGGRGLVYTLAVIAVARLCGYPTQLHHHSFNYVDERKVLMRAILRTAPCMTHIFLCSIMRDKFEACYRPQITRIVSNAAFVPPHPILRVPADTGIVLGHLSNLTRDKGLYTFLDLLGRVGSEVRGVLAGPVMNYEDQVAIEAAIRDLDGRLEYRGPLYGVDKIAFYDEIDLFIFPTDYVNEAQPTVLFEALAAGCKLISFNRGCIMQQVNDDGLVVARGEDFVSQALAWIVANGPALRPDREATRRRYSERHEIARAAIAQLFHSNSAQDVSR
jgi:glycosyltransferase involved in cell wall biosynthesis